MIIFRYSLIVATLIKADLIFSKGLTYKELSKDGIVSGFREKNGHPLKYLNQIAPITNPRYVRVAKNLYLKKELCIGTLTIKGWRFSPLSVLNYREIVNHSGDNSLCFCPLAGLAISIKGDMEVSGLLKYDAFVLHEKATGDLLLPYDQGIYKKNDFIPFANTQLLTYEGIMAYFPNALILASTYPHGEPYGSYSSSRRQGVGHAKPALKSHYKFSRIGLHPKERVLLVGFEGKIQKGYPFSELKKHVGSQGGFFSDFIHSKLIYVHYEPKYQWAFAEDEYGASLNVGYSYMFALYQHRPDLPIYRF